MMSICAVSHASVAPAWTLTALGKAEETLQFSLPDSSELTLNATGREAYVGRDEGRFAGIQTDASGLRLTARIAKVEGLPGNAKVGLMFREGLKGTERNVTLRYDGYELNRCLQWFSRLKIRPGQAEGSQTCFRDGLIREANELEGTWLRLERRHPFVDMYWSEDGESWNRVPHQAALLKGEIWAGFLVTAGGSGAAKGKVTFDSISLDILDETPAESVVGAELPKREWEMHMVRVEHPGKGSFNPFLLMPKGMKPEEVRGIVLSSGSKEVQMDEGALPFDSGPKSVKGKLRKPAEFPDYEGGVYSYQDGNYHGVLLAQQGLIRLGGAWPPELFPLAVEALEQHTSVPLSKLPIFPTGASFAGGFSAKFAHLYRDQIHASAPTLIGLAGGGWENPAFEVPHLHIIGEKDGKHMKDLLRNNARLRAQKAKWGGAVMWTLGHRHGEADALIYPWFFEFLNEQAATEYEEGWYGDLRSWKSASPKILPLREHQGDDAEMTWLPSEKSARIWQAFVSYKPQVMIQYPTFDGYAPFMGPNKQTCTVLNAGEPFPLVASGPLAEDLTLELWNADQRLELKSLDPEDPYALSVAGLPEGMHTLILKARLAGREIISNPVMLLVVSE